MPRGKKATKSPPNTAVGATGRVEPGQERQGPEQQGRVAAMDVTLTAASGMGEDKTPLALRVEQAMNEAGTKAREAGAEPDEILHAKIGARYRVMSEVTGEPVPPEYREGSRKAPKKAAKAPRKAAVKRKAKK